ncbi:MAG: PRC-barrel domain-containing protein, partial [Bacteroidales bacterium]|nr:PRC-barrel domain-containing protein [Bacteroidales bacterium]
MPAVTTFYLSNIINSKIYSSTHKVIGKLTDIVVDVNFKRPKVVAAKAKLRNKTKMLDIEQFNIYKRKNHYLLKCNKIEEVDINHDNFLFLAKNVLDKQIVDMDDKKVERVNDIRLAILSTGTFVLAVDVGVEGLLRRLGIAKPVNTILKPTGINIPSDFILWDDVEAINYHQLGIKLSKPLSKLSTLHPSDLADIIEDLDRNTQLALFSSLDEEKAADVLEELEPEAQVSLIEDLSTEKAADVLEKMPADEAADLLDDLEEEKVEELLSEMKTDASEEVRELMKYHESIVGSIMNTDFFHFHENNTVIETIDVLRKLKPEPAAVYSLFVLDRYDKLRATVSLRDLIISEPGTKLKQIMNKDIKFVRDTDKTNILAEMISKYNLLAVPVV